MPIYNELYIPETRISIFCEACNTPLYSKSRYIFDPGIGKGESFHFCMECYGLIKTRFMPLNNNIFDYIRIIKFYQWCERNGSKPDLKNINGLIQAYMSQVVNNYFSDVPRRN